jgi:hypothetical protein
VSFELLGNPSAINRLNFFNNSSNAMSMFTLDEIRLVPVAVVPVPGDVNNDGVVDLNDAVRALKIMVINTTTLDTAGDVNGDSKIGIEE